MTKPPDFDPEFVRDISLAVYLDRLGPDGSKKAVAEVGIETIRKRAASYDTLTKAYLRAIQANPIPPIPQAAETIPMEIEVLDPTPFVLEEVPQKAPIRGRKSQGYTQKSAKKTK